MPTWPAYFVGIIALAFALQVVILAAIFFQLKRSMDQFAVLTSDLHTRILPIMDRLEQLLNQAQPRLNGMVADASEVVHLARSQAQKVDRILTEILDRMRIQIVHADQILTGVLETIEDTGTTFRRTLLGPVQQAAAFVRGIKSGLDVLRSFRRPARSSASAPAAGQDSSDEGMFI
jgi:hypothetical protein